LVLLYYFTYTDDAWSNTNQVNQCSIYMHPDSCFLLCLNLQQKKKTTLSH